MPATPITNPVAGESLVGTEPQLLQHVDPGWRHRLNLFMGRALSDTALQNEQLYRSGLLATLGQSVTAGTVTGLALTMDTTVADPVLAVSPGYGIAPNGEDVVLNRPLKTALSTLTVVDSVAENVFQQFITTPNAAFAGVLMLQPVVAQVSGQNLDTGTGPIEVTGNLGASCDQDPEEYAFEDWQVADGVRLVLVPWPSASQTLVLPPLSPQQTLRNRLAYTIFGAEALLGPDDQLPWGMLGVPVALIAFDSGASWKPLFVDCSAVVRAGGLARRRIILPSPGNLSIAQPALAQARINQLSEQLSQTMAQHLQFNTLADIFPIMPPSGLLPVAALDFQKKRAAWLPLNWSVSAAPVHLEELETVLKTGMAEAPIAAQTTAPTDSKLVEPVEVLIPLPDSVYDPKILVTEVVAPVFQQEVNKATQARNLTLQRLRCVRQELNTLFVALGPNVPANPNLIDLDAGLTTNEMQGRNTPPPYLPASTETFGTLLPTSWAKSTAYSAGQFVIDSNGTLQVVQTAGTSGAVSPTWNTTVGQTTQDNTVSWINNGSWVWQPNAVYVAGQFIVDANGSIQVVKTGGISASAQPALSQTAGQNTFDGIPWVNNGNSPWTPDNLYTEGQLILDSNGNIQIVQTGGISGDSMPSPWNPNPGQTTPDSGVTWENLGHSVWQPNIVIHAGQAIIDSNGNIQLAQIGGTTGAAIPSWNRILSATSSDASITWTNSGILIWQSAKAYAVNQIIADSNGNIQLVQTAGTSGTLQPRWSTTPNGPTTDGTVTWVYLSFNSADLSQLKTIVAQPPYTSSFQDSQGTHTISLLSANDLNDLASNGLQHLITSLNARISQANDLLDTAFLTAQTDIYRYRQNILGSTAASALATSPVLANIATGETATATAADLQNYINTIVPPAGSTTPAPVLRKPSVTPSTTPLLQPGTGRFLPAISFSSPASGTVTRAQFVSNQSIVSSGTLARLTQINGGTAAPTGPMRPINIRGSGVFNLGQAAAGGPTAAPGGAAAAPSEGAAAGPSPADITGQSPITGAQLNIRTLTVAQRLQQSPSWEAMFYSISNRLSFLQILEKIENDLGLVADDLQILVDGPPPPPPPTPPSTPPPPAPAPVETHFFYEWRGANQSIIQTKIQAPYLNTDPSEATLFSVGIHIAEQHTALLRALEARVQQYVDFVALCTSALNNIQNNIQQAQTYVTQLQNALVQDRQNVAFTTALLNDETQRVNNVNVQRLEILQSSVQLVAYTRARTLEPIDTTPSRQLVPANITNPVPACLQQSVAIPPELREIVGLLREAPLSWLPAAASQVANLGRPILLQQLALHAQTRAAQQLQIALLPSSATGEPGVYAPAISTVYSANQQVFRNLQIQRAAFQPASLTNLGWSLQVATIQSVAAANDLIAAEVVHAEISMAISRLIEQISSVATCLYTRVSIALPVNRLAWAEYLRGAGMSVGLQSLAILPNWNQLNYVDRQPMQLLVDWLFQQIDTSNSAAAAFMSDVVRTAILLASDVPVDSIIPGRILLRVRPAVGGIVTLNLPSDRISSGMYVHLYSGATLAAHAVVSDLDTRTVSATVTDVFTPGVYIEASDTAHFTAQAPRALAIRPLFSQS